MITDSSKNYLDNTLTLVYDGEDISNQEIFDFCKRNYGVEPVEFDIEPPNVGFGGFPNPGIVKVQLPYQI
jgi:hypothetical protein